MPNQLMIFNQPIPLDDKLRINLNALHRASDLGKSKQPSNWFRLSTTKEIIQELNSSDLRSLPINTIEGRNGGTYVHELLAVSYAGWISPKFQLMVNQAFIDARKVDAVAVVPAYIRQELLKCNPFWQQIQRYYALHLTQVEMGKLLSCSASHIRDQLKRMARCGLIDYQPNPELSKAGRKAYLMLVNGR